MLALSVGGRPGTDEHAVGTHGAAAPDVAAREDAMTACVCCKTLLPTPRDVYGPIGEPWCFACWVTDPQGEAGCRSPRLGIGWGHRAALASTLTTLVCERCGYKAGVLVEGLCVFCNARGHKDDPS